MLCRCLHLLYIPLCLSSLLFSCGKAIEKEPLPVEGSTQPIEEQDKGIRIKSIRSENFSDDPQDYVVSVGRHKFDKEVFVVIPEYLEVLEGNAGNQEAVIKFNVIEEFSQMYCKYRGQALTQFPDSEFERNKGLKYVFDDCYDSSHASWGIKPGESFLQKAGYSITVKILGSDTRYETEAQGNFITE